MKKNRLLVSAVIPMLCLAAHAQECKKDYAPKKGDITLALTVGYNSYANINAPSATYVGDEAQTINWTDKGLMVGFEAGWFVSDNWKLDLGGGLSFTNNPGYAGTPGVGNYNDWDDESITIPGLPEYRPVADAQKLSYNVYAGIDRYFGISGVPNLKWYLGARFGASFCQSQKKYDDKIYMSNSGSASIEILSMGKSVGQTWNLQGAIAAGVDYYLLPALYIGAQINPFCYTYNKTTWKPQEGMKSAEADSHNFNLLAAPTLKLGFKF